MFAGGGWRPEDWTRGALKLQVIASNDDTQAEVTVDPWEGDTETVAESIAAVLDGQQAPDAVGHRIVHGGDQTRAAMVTSELRDRMLQLAPLAPLHQDRAVAALDAARQALPSASHVACFDTAFHTTIPDAARAYALPAEWRDGWAIHRHGFHGLSHAWAARQTPVIVDCAPEGLRIVSCHLGGGSSLCAIEGERSLDTTMGFTPLEGIPMKTRSGSLDPGIVLWLVRHAGFDRRRGRRRSRAPVRHGRPQRHER